jgi:hypothetical protein
MICYGILSSLNKSVVEKCKRYPDMEVQLRYRSSDHPRPEGLIDSPLRGIRNRIVPRGTPGWGNNLKPLITRSAHQHVCACHCHTLHCHSTAETLAK